MKKEEDIIGYDFQGWPIYKMTIREILEVICEHKDGKYTINDNSPTLDIYPRVLEDDGMGYGTNDQYITEFSIGDNCDYCNIFVDKKQDIDQ